MANEKTLIGRRGLLAASAGFLGASVSSGRGQASNDSEGLVPPWSKEQGAPIRESSYGEPSPFEKNVVRRPRGALPTFPSAGTSDTPLQNLTGIITPNGLVYERHHAGIPPIDPAQHRLLIHGLVDRPLILTMDELTRFPSVSRLHFLECSGNSSATWTGGNPKWTVQDTHGLLSCCEWTGVLLSTLLDEVGIKPAAKWVLAEGADAAGLSRSVPIDKALDDAIVVYAQNGEKLRPEQGYPVRLFLPGYEGNMSVKWLRRLKLGEGPFQTREETSKYTDLMPDGTARQFTFIMEAKSVITFPSGGHHLKGPGFYEISGLAWTGRGRIKRVEVSTDGGTSWHEAQLQEPVLSKCLTRFRLPWTWDGGPATLQSRATDETGYIQPPRRMLTDVRGFNSYYHLNGIHPWHIDPSGGVSNVA